jgi:radical SAM superfamily enzyme YgiQ (UPF0313 family)
MESYQRRILLITPPYYRLYKDTYSLDRYPLALGYLSGVILERTSWEVMAYNADFCRESEPLKVSYLAGEGFDNYLKNLNDPDSGVWNEIRKTVQAFRPSVVGLSCMTQNSKGAYNIARIVKEFDKNTLVVMGGPHATMLRSEVLDYPYIDVCAVGEGEETIVELLNALDRREDFDSVSGILFRKGGKVVETPPRKLIKELDYLPVPHQSAPQVLKDFDKYPPDAFRHIFAVRGCPFNCIFCGSRYIWGRKPRYRSPENVVEEIKSLNNEGVNSVCFEDDSFGIKESYVLALCEQIKTCCPDTAWSCEMHVKSVTDHIISVMKSSGCSGITLGIESGNNGILKMIRKKNTIEDCFRAARIINRHTLHLGAFFMVGFPWETEETLKDTMKAMKRIKCDTPVYSIFTPYKGTEAFAVCKKMGLINEDYDFSLYNHQSPLNCFCNIPKERFRELCSKMEKVTDRDSFYYKIRELISVKTLKKIMEIGMTEAVGKGLQMIRADGR